MKLTTAVILGVFTTASAGVMADHRHHDYDHDYHYSSHHAASYHEHKAHKHHKKAKKHYRIAKAHKKAARREARRDAYYRDVSRYSRSPYGEVIDVEPVYRVYHKPVRHESCLRRDNARPAYTSHTATILGAVIGGAIGHQVGDAHGDADVAAVAGGILGASVGRDIGQRAAYNRTLRVEGPCRVRHETETVRELVEYKVTYRYNGSIHHASMDHHPGDWVKLDVDVSPA